MYPKFIPSKLYSIFYILVWAFFSSCSKDQSDPVSANNLPTFSNPASSPVSGITANSARFAVALTGDGGSALLAKGVVWHTGANPTVSLATKTTDTSGSSGFESLLTGLTPNTSYFARAYATNANGTAYGKEWQFTTLSAPPTITDLEGNIYETVQIGTQTWMKSNLKTSKYRNGDIIPSNLSDSAWKNTASGAFAVYNNDTSFNYTYGKLYNWFSVTDPRGLCPTGWHVPDDSEWKTLESYLGMQAGELDVLPGGRGSAQNVGGKLKAVSSLWTSPNLGATDQSGFSGLPGGGRYCNFSYFCAMGYYGYWWTTTETSATRAIYRNLYFNGAASFRDTYHKIYGLSVRCVKD